MDTHQIQSFIDRDRDEAKVRNDQGDTLARMEAAAAREQAYKEARYRRECEEADAAQAERDRVAAARLLAERDQPTIAALEYIVQALRKLETRTNSLGYTIKDIERCLGYLTAGTEQ